MVYALQLEKISTTNVKNKWNNGLTLTVQNHHLSIVTACQNVMAYFNNFFFNFQIARIGGGCKPFKSEEWKLSILVSFYISISTQFKYLRATITEDARSVHEIKIRIAVTTWSLSKLKTIWRDKNISMRTRMSLLRALVTSVFLYGCETWMLNAEWEKRIQLFWDELHAQIPPGPLYLSHFQQADQGIDDKLHSLGEHEHLLTIVKRRQLTWFGHVIRWKGSLANTLLQGGTDGDIEREKDL